MNALPSKTIVALLTVMALTFAACGDDQGTAKDKAPVVPSKYGFGDSQVDEYRKLAREAPRAQIASEPPPSRLTFEDLRQGTGPQVALGDEVIVNYVGYHYANRKRFDSSYGLSGLPYRVVPGRGDFIEGFEEGLVGMRAGGRRQITIPPDKGYGSDGYNTMIKPGETLVFVVDLETLDKR